jgi:hypothetical protein
MTAGGRASAAASGEEVSMTRVRSRPSGRIARLRRACTALLLAAGPALADETCQSPYMVRITGVEDFVYVWTLGVEGLGDGSDKLVTVDVREGSPTFGRPIHAAPVGGRHEAHHGGFTDDRRQFWAGRRGCRTAGSSSSTSPPTRPSRASCGSSTTSSRRAAARPARTAPMRCRGAC